MRAYPVVEPSRGVNAERNRSPSVQSSKRPGGDCTRAAAGPVTARASRYRSPPGSTRARTVRRVRRLPLAARTVVVRRTLYDAAVTPTTCASTSENESMTAVRVTPGASRSAAAVGGAVVRGPSVGSGAGVSGSVVGAGAVAKPLQPATSRSAARTTARVTVGAAAPAA
jgi:hypothetical protein